MGIVRLIRVWRFKRKVRRFANFFGDLDRAISKHSPRWKRQQFWRDFWKSDEFRKAFIKEVPKILFKDL